MITRMGEKVALSFWKNNIIDKKDIDVYKYGAELVISQTLATLMIFGIGIILGDIKETLIYYLTYTSLRVYAGGFHASCYRNCNAIYLVVYFFINLIISSNATEKMAFLLFVGLILADIIIIMLAPVADLRRELGAEETKKYRYIVRRILFFVNCIIISVFLFIIELQDEILYAIAAVCEIAVLLILGHMKNYYSKSEGGV